jgi:hypothetical protein
MMKLGNVNSLTHEDIHRKFDSANLLAYEDKYGNLYKGNSLSHEVNYRKSVAKSPLYMNTAAGTSVVPTTFHRANHRNLINANYLSQKVNSRSLGSGNFVTQP